MLHSGAEWCATQKLIMVTGKPRFRVLDPVFIALGYRNTANRGLNYGQITGALLLRQVRKKMLMSLCGFAGYARILTVHNRQSCMAPSSMNDSFKKPHNFTLQISVSFS